MHALHKDTDGLFYEFSRGDLCQLCQRPILDARTGHRVQLAPVGVVFTKPRQYECVCAGAPTLQPLRRSDACPSCEHSHCSCDCVTCYRAHDRYLGGEGFCHCESCLQARAIARGDNVSDPQPHAHVHVLTAAAATAAMPLLQFNSIRVVTKASYASKPRTVIVENDPEAVFIPRGKPDPSMEFDFEHAWDHFDALKTAARRIEERLGRVSSKLDEHELELNKGHDSRRRADSVSQVPGVHLAVRHTQTGLFGCYATPLVYISTACRQSWAQYPNRALRPSLVTCDDCRSFAIANDLVDGWAHRTK